MPSNVENILNAILTGDGSGIQKPASRVEELLFEIYEQGGGGGGESVIGGIKLTIDENYVMTATLVDKDGEEYGVGDDIDLPLEEMVVDAEYDPQTQKIKLELKNGNYAEFSVAELVSGLQTELSSSNKLNPAYIDYDASHRAVSDDEKTAWNAKQNAISDLETIRSGAAAGATAVQPSVMQTALDGKQDTISDLATIRSGASAGATAVQPATMSAALAAKQDSLSETQLAAVNSGINSTKVAQIETNKTNILYSLQTGVKNLFNPEASGNWQHGLSSYSADAKTGTISIAVTASDWARTSVPIILPAGEYKFCGNVTALVGSAVITGNTSSSGQETAIFNNIELSTTGTFEISFTLNAETPFWIAVYANFSSSIVSNSVTITGMMICTKATWDQEPNVYRPFALPNYDLTQLEQQDRNALAEVVDSGAKNRIKLTQPSGNGITLNPSLSVTVNEKTGVVTVSGTTVASDVIYLTDAYSNLDGYVLSGKPEITEDYLLRAYSVVGDVGMAEDAGDGNGGVISGNQECRVSLYVYANKSYNFTFKPMVCNMADWNISHAFVPYRPDYDTLVNGGAAPFFTIPINHNMIYRGKNLGDTLTDAQHTALSGGNFTDLYLGDYWTKTVTIPAGTYTGGDGEEVTVPAQTNITLKAVIADFDTFYAGYASTYAGINTHHAAVIVTGFGNVVWNKTSSTAGGYVNSLIHKWLVGSVLPQIETWFGSAKVLSHQKLLTNAITGDAASGWAWSDQKISLLSENQMYGSKVWGNSKATNGGYEPGEAFKHLSVFNHIDANLLFGNKNIWLRDITSAVGSAVLGRVGNASDNGASDAWFAPAALILLS